MVFVLFSRSTHKMITDSCIYDCKGEGLSYLAKQNRFRMVVPHLSLFKLPLKDNIMRPFVGVLAPLDGVSQNIIQIDQPDNYQHLHQMLR